MGFLGCGKWAPMGCQSSMILRLRKRQLNGGKKLFRFSQNSFVFLNFDGGLTLGFCAVEHHASACEIFLT